MERKMDRMAAPQSLDDVRGVYAYVGPRKGTGKEFFLVGETEGQRGEVTCSDPSH